MPKHILVVDDQPEVLATAERILQSAKHETVGVSSAPEALQRLADCPFDLLISDVAMPGMDGLELLSKLNELGSTVPVVMISGSSTIEIAVQALKLGAVDFVEKPLQVERLLLSVRNALRMASLEKTNQILEREATSGAELIGDSLAMQELRQLIDKVGPSEGRVLIFGENGTGKELVANAIHRISSRSNEPLVKLNCGAVAENLVESELFGHEKGAFTGASATRKGRFELADGGTLFLDEIGDMPMPMQVKLLRVLQEGCFERVGGGKTIAVDVRVIAATNRDLGAMVDDGSFREDLYYRLNVVTMTMPALRDRPTDIKALVAHFISQALEDVWLDEGAVIALQNYPFLGNVRELQNFVERMLILHPGETLCASDIEHALPPRRSRVPLPQQLFVEGVSFREIITGLERRVLLEALQANGNDKGKAAKMLQLERSFFYRKCRLFDINTEL